MDLITGETVNVTEVYNTYEISYYDGYHDMFICNTFGSETMAYSREYILNEAKAQ